VIATILRKEIFYIQREGQDGNSFVLKAVPFPQPAPRPTTAPSPNAAQ
jgi:hypothetical protein